MTFPRPHSNKVLAGKESEVSSVNFLLVKSFYFHSQFLYFQTSGIPWMQRDPPEERA